MTIEKCEDRQIIKVSGKDNEVFLNNIATNNVKQGLTYAALLTPQGKYFCDFFLFRRKNDIFIDIYKPFSESLISRLNTYKLRADVNLELIDMPVSRGQGSTVPTALIDPRHDSLGWRIYDVLGEESKIDWKELYVGACIPQSGIELIQNNTYILEARFEELSGVDFKKGCFIGQEVTARMKHKTKLRKGFSTVLVEGAAEIGTPILSDGNECGFLFSQSSGKGIAYLRYDKVSRDMCAGDAVVNLTEKISDFE